MKQFLAILFAAACICAAIIVTAGNTNEAMAFGPKVAICHIPPGNPDNAHTIIVDDNSVKLIAHLKHGDTEGGCVD